VLVIEFICQSEQALSVWGANGAMKQQDPEARLEFGRRLVEKLRKMENVRCADLEFPVEFFEDRGLWMMDVETLEDHAIWAKPLTVADERRLERLARHPYLADLRPMIQHMLARGLKLEQEAVVLRNRF